MRTGESLSARPPGRTVRERLRRRPAAVLAAAASLAACLTAPSASAAAAAVCTDRNGWIPSGTIGQGVPHVTDTALLRLADVDGDADDDLLLLDEIGGIRAWRNNGTDMPGGGGWAYMGRIALGAGYPPARVRFADLDRDGDDDYLVIKDDGAIDGYVNNGGDLTGTGGITPGWTPVGQVAQGTGVAADQIHFADLDGDGDDDYLTLQYTGPVQGWRNDGGDGPGGGGWSPWGKVREGVPLPADFGRQEIHDVNCDGRDDYLLLSDDSSLYAYENQGETPGAETRFGWSTLTLYAHGTGDAIDRIMFGELNGDGRVDYIVMAPNGSLVGYLNNGGDQ
ncbi:VCBS repeat protein [Actinocorallia herbida]|uniref:VCBS repeat protein n=1 Tax=Actinocorallia herbida TaxID=58109 RepID=A0A3N1D198_9ACTN|nr:VCBS repeat-containing protein [Actinocorallia herbida]ROO87305.1 VCBS repeat protein [Actinocorallia herbida]